MKNCNSCGVEKPLSEFHKKGTGHDHRCKDCAKAYKAGRRDEIFAQSLKRRFNITVEQYNAILENQGGVCFICHTPEPVGNPYWQVDHDHACCPKRPSCGSCIRGILCFDCNMMLGYYERIKARSEVRILQLDRYLSDQSLPLDKYLL